MRDLPPGEGSDAGPANTGKGFTLLALIKQVDDGPALAEDGAPPVAPEERVIVDSSGVVLEGTAGALEMLRVTAAELTSTAVLLSDIIPSWSYVAATAATDLGAVVELQVRVRICGGRGGRPSLTPPPLPPPSQPLKARAGQGAPLASAATSGALLSHAAQLASVFGAERAPRRPVRVWVQVRRRRCWGVGCGRELPPPLPRSPSPSATAPCR